MDAFWFTVGCIVGSLGGVFVVALALGLCRAAATGDPESEYFIRMLDGDK